MIHLTGPAITCGSHRRQRCSWCGTIIEDVDLANVSMPICGKPYYPPGEEYMHRVLGAGYTEECRREMGHSGDHGQRQPGDFELAGWPFEKFVDIDGENPRVTSVVEEELHEDGTVKIPQGSCMSLPFELTGRQ